MHATAALNMAVGGSAGRAVDVASQSAVQSSPSWLHKQCSPTDLTLTMPIATPLTVSRIPTQPLTSARHGLAERTACLIKIAWHAPLPYIPYDFARVDHDEATFMAEVVK